MYGMPVRSRVQRNTS